MQLRPVEDDCQTNARQQGEESQPEDFQANNQIRNGSIEKATGCLRRERNTVETALKSGNRRMVSKKENERN